VYTPDSGDEWGNAVAPFRVLYERGDPNVFLHPSLYYYVTALAYAAAGLSMSDLFVLDPRWFVYAARAVSVLSTAAAIAALHALGARLWNRGAGLFAAALLPVLPLHAVYSRAGPSSSTSSSASCGRWMTPAAPPPTGPGSSPAWIVTFSGGILSFRQRDLSQLRSRRAWWLVVKSVVDVFEVASTSAIAAVRIASPAQPRGSSLGHP
jgi:hypothetical protein